MPAIHYSITKKDLLDLFTRLAEKSRVFVPYGRNNKSSPASHSIGERQNVPEHNGAFEPPDCYFGEFDPSKELGIELGGVRQSQPFKSFLNPAREIVLGKKKNDDRPVIVAGVKACDLSSLVLQDYVFLKGDCEDPFYAFHRDNTLIISCDCTYAKETCFCVAMAGKPYPTKGFDLNLSLRDGFFIAEAGSDKGRAIIDNYKTFFKDCEDRDISERDGMREKVSLQVKDFVKKREAPDTSAINGNMQKNYDNLPLWQDAASTCVECGACNLVCPTCHCFLLFDNSAKLSGNLEPFRGFRASTGLAGAEPGQRVDENPERNIGRGKVWDACLYKTFAKVAGNHNPRKHLYERMRNRFDKKFAFFPQVLDYFACTGCGRCIEACPGNIDIREVLKGVVTGKWNKPPHK